MRNAHGLYKARLKDIAKENKEKKSSLGTAKQNQLTKNTCKKRMHTTANLRNLIWHCKTLLRMQARSQLLQRQATPQVSQIQATPQVSQTLVTPQFLQVQAALLVVLFLKEKLWKNDVQPLCHPFKKSLANHKDQNKWTYRHFLKSKNFDFSCFNIYILRFDICIIVYFSYFLWE